MFSFYRAMSFILLTSFVYTSVTKCVNIYKTFSESEKAQKFLEILYEKLRNYVEENPEAITQIDVLLSYIDQNYTKFSTTFDAIVAFWNYYNDNSDFAIKMNLIIASTSGVALVAYGTGFVGIIKGWVSPFSNLIPSCLTATSNGFSIVLGF